MHLLDSKTLKLCEFIGSDIPLYAILSHTWGHDEVSMQDMLNDRAIHKEGYEKIKRCCELAQSDGFDYAWIDTFCIDKTSSAELSEAINSMYRWYEKSGVCYVILTDVASDEDCDHEMSSFRKSRWFTRGWTLQELIAPANVIFYAKDWREIGTKFTLQHIIVEITNINLELLSGTKKVSQFSIAQRMCWASRRQTTRREDIAYCLMGIFDVNMPLLYGEGDKAFFRLQKEILSASEDDSILAWTGPDSHFGCLAASPVAFADAKDIVYDGPWPSDTASRPSNSSHTLTNKGLYIEVESIQTGVLSDILGSFVAVLKCRDRISACRIGIEFSDRTKIGGQGVVRIGQLEPQFITEKELRETVKSISSIYIEVLGSTDGNGREKSLLAGYVETRGLRENGIRFVDYEGTATTRYMFLGNEALHISTATFCWFSDSFLNHLRASTTLRFFCCNTESIFDIMIKDQSDSIERAVPIASIFDPVTEKPGQFSHRSNWHDLTERTRIKVTIRPFGKREDIRLVLADGDLYLLDKRFRSGTYKAKEAYKITIEWDEPGDFKVYEPLSLEKMIRLQNQEMQY
ncbi:hypothetical protein EG329_008755 [Mollisiaceae sp. DMI_Dod_QoI]|nr:hypothetical protein EG329_008755 [Helotiales sp. DMI_Dod_QoI]